MRFRAANGWAVSVLLATVGCGQVRDDSDTGGGAAGSGDEAAMGLDFAQSGSRLVAMGYSSNEAKVFRTFHDSKLGFDCHFVSDAAGAFQRCVPDEASAVIYTDAGCSEPATWERWGPRRWAAGEAVSGVADASTGDCPGDASPHREVYRVAEQLTEEVLGPPAQPLFALVDSRCQLATPPAKGTPAVHRLVPLAETELVRAQTISVNLGDGLRLTRLVADDGAALNWGITGADRVSCEIQRDGECVPEPIARPSSLASLVLASPSASADGKFWSALNADCSEPAFGTPYSPTCGTARFGVEDDGVAPPKVVSLTDAPALFSLDFVTPVTEPLSYVCTARAGSGAERAAAPGVDLTGTMPSVSQLQRGSGPLRVNWYSKGQRELLPVLADFQRASPGYVFSPQFVTDAGVPCQITAVDDGTERCVVMATPSQPSPGLATAPEVVWGPL